MVKFILGCDVYVMFEHGLIKIFYFILSVIKLSAFTIALMGH